MCSDEYWMNKALALAHQAARLGEVPVGAVVVRDDRVIGEGFNQPVSALDATAHAELCAIRQANQVAGNYRLPGATLYVTIEPCTMCVGALVHARIRRLVFGAPEPKSGAVVSANRLLDHPAMNHKVEYSGDVLAGQCAKLMSGFFAKRRQEKRQLKQLKNSE
ncbi:MAG: tRNA adenosine(34) deaminase TadA [Gammaproteobacteria bacterium]|nr:MAG: tRNA adenosine(34) deaminase TadA [Gammaproteobacteria bacterium]